MQIRLAQINNSDSISHLLLQLGYTLSSAEVESMIFSHRQQDNDIYVMVQAEDIVAVMSLIYFDYFPDAKRICRITSLVVDEQLRGHGLGRKFVSFAKARAIDKQCYSLELTTNIRRHQTHRFYEQQGFDKTSYKFVMPLSSTN